MRGKSLFIVWTDHSQRAETLAAEWVQGLFPVRDPTKRALVDATRYLVQG